MTENERLSDVLLEREAVDYLRGAWSGGLARGGYLDEAASWSEAFQVLVARASGDAVRSGRERLGE